jgi:hypothetical protein
MSVDWGAADSLTIGSLAKQRGVRLDREHLECSKTIYVNPRQDTVIRLPDFASSAAKLPLAAYMQVGRLCARCANTCRDPLPPIARLR